MIAGINHMEAFKQDLRHGLHFDDGAPLSQFIDLAKYP